MNDRLIEDLRAGAATLCEEDIRWAGLLECAALEIERLRGVEADAAKMRAFCREALHEFWEGDGSMQDMGERHGLLIATEATEPCGDACSCAEYGADFPTYCYRFSPILAARSGADESQNG